MWEAWQSEHMWDRNLGNCNIECRSSPSRQTWHTWMKRTFFPPQSLEDIASQCDTISLKTFSIEMSESDTTYLLSSLCEGAAFEVFVAKIVRMNFPDGNFHFHFGFFLWQWSFSNFSGGNDHFQFKYFWWQWLFSKFPGGNYHFLFWIFLVVHEIGFSPGRKVLRTLWTMSR